MIIIIAEFLQPVIHSTPLATDSKKTFICMYFTRCPPVWGVLLERELKRAEILKEMAWESALIFGIGRSQRFILKQLGILSCQPRVTVTSCFVYNC